MTSGRDPARRLLALLDDERTIETRPAADVRADLAAHGVDPAPAIALARRLASERASPASVLLDAVVDDEATEDDVGRLETAPIAEVRGAVPAGTAASVAAGAGLRAGRPSNVVGIRRARSRRLVLGWTGSLAGIAACLVVLAVVWPDIPGLDALRRPTAPDQSVAMSVEQGAPADQDSSLDERAIDPQDDRSAAPGLARLAAPTAPAEPQRAPAAPTSRLQYVAPPGPVGGAPDAASPSEQEAFTGEFRSGESADSRPVAEEVGRSTAAPVSPGVASDAELRALGEAAGRLVGRVAVEQDRVGPPDTLSDTVPGEPPAPGAAVLLEPVPADIAPAVPTTRPKPEQPVSQLADAAPAVPVPSPKPDAPAPTSDEIIAALGTDQQEVRSGGVRVLNVVAAPESSAPPVTSALPELESAFVTVEQPAGAVAVTGLSSETEIAALRAPDERVTALLIVDPTLLPEPVSAIGPMARANLPEGDLIDRLADARRAANGRAVVALVSLEGPAGARDAAIVVRDATDELAQFRLPPTLLRGLLGDRAVGYELVTIPAR